MATFTDERIAAMLRGRRQVFRVPFPGSADVEVGFRILTDAELDHCRLEAARQAKKLGADLDADPELLERLIERQIVWRACVDPDSDAEKPGAFFPSASDVATLDSVLVRELSNAYMEVQELVSPRVTLDEAGVKELVDALGKEPGATALLTRFAPPTLIACVRSLAARLRTSASSSSSTSPAS
jgi:hypothetical protein